MQRRIYSYTNEEDPYSTLLACLHDQNKSGFFEGPAFIQPIRV